VSEETDGISLVHRGWIPAATSTKNLGRSSPLKLVLAHPDPDNGGWHFITWSHLFNRAKFLKKQLSISNNSNSIDHLQHHLSSYSAESA
jgi:hypothetical protein